MISGANYAKKIIKQKSLHDKIDDKSQKQSKSVTQSVLSQRPKIKARVQRQRPAIKQQIKKVTEVKLNQIKKDTSENQSSQVFSKQNGKVKISIKKLNSNGFSNFPPPFTQILPPVIIIAMIIEIVLVSIKFLINYQSYIVLGFLIFLLIPISYFWYITTSISPTDSIQLQHLQQIKHPSTSTFSPQKHKYFCNLCKTCISQRSFHCNRCHRCVEYFDHHCKWLNNCIGSKNYLQFVQLVVWTELFMIFFYTCNAITIIKICNQYDQLPGILWYAITMVVISIAPFIAVSMLLCLHLYLIIAKRSTIQLILQNRKKNKIYPQNLNIQFVQNNEKLSLPQREQSPSGQPSFIKQNSILKDMNEQNNESLIKFMTNLSNNLKFTRKASKQKQQKKYEPFMQRKINFKPTILKKSTSIVRNQFKSNTVKTNKVQIQVEQRKQTTNKEPSKQNQDEVIQSEDQQIQDTCKNLVSKLRFSTKNQIFDEPLQIKTSKNTDRQLSKSHTERVQSSKRKQSHPKKLESLNKHQTERKIKFKTKVQTFNKENKHKKQESDQHAQQTNLQFHQKESKNIQKKKKRKKEIEESQSTRLFKVFAAQNKQQQD